MGVPLHRGGNALIVLKKLLFFKIYLRQSVVEGYQRARDDGDVHEVPEVPEVGPGVEHHAKVQDLEHALQGEDGREAVVGLLQDLAFIYLFKMKHMLELFACFVETHDVDCGLVVHWVLHG